MIISSFVILVIQDVEHSLICMILVVHIYDHMFIPTVLTVHFYDHGVPRCSRMIGSVL